MKRILFVDDNELICEFYKAMFLGEKRWEIATASSGETALELMRQTPFGIVASDMRMDGMDGIQLLNEVLKRHPQTSRVIISGVADQAEAADALRSTHQFLAKPVDVNMLRAMLVRLDGLDSFLRDEKLKELAGRLRVLPSFPCSTSKS
jgi:DNA-binding NtrC family response regulator